MDSFADHYRAIVLPRLREHCRLPGLLVEAGAMVFSEAFDQVFREAWRLGASRLPADKVLALEDWIASRILIEADAASDAVRDSRDVSDRVASQIKNWEAALCPETM